MPIYEQDVKLAALREFRDEQFRSAVEREKARLRTRKWYQRLFPFTITIKWSV
jgi:hypothetical protein